jgi:hypothetical protein
MKKGRVKVLVLLLGYLAAIGVVVGSISYQWEHYHTPPTLVPKRLADDQ